MKTTNHQEDLPFHKLQPVDLTAVKFDDKGKVIYGTGVTKGPVVSVRPTHKSGKPKIEKTTFNNKKIYNNYGHSGIGWTLLFGTVNKSISLFLSENPNFEKSNPINIIGLGCIGLTTAVTLHQHGFTNITLIGEKDPNTMPSYNAGGLIELSLTNVISAGGLNEKGFEKIKQTNFDDINKYFIDSYNTFNQIFNK